MRPDISEFTYGFAITDEIIHNRHKPITTAPVFPSLYEEGQTGGGYDVSIHRIGIPLFLQFKLSHYFSRSNAREIRDGTFNGPYYRMYLRPLRHSNQHNLLLGLEHGGNKVYYCAPIFYMSAELNDAFLNHRVPNRSLWIKPLWIGVLPDNDLHYVAFQSNRNKHLRSEKKKLIEQSADYEDFTEDIYNAIKEKGHEALKPENLVKLANFMSKIFKENIDIDEEEWEEKDEILKKSSPIRRIAFYSSVYFDCQLYVASLMENFQQKSDLK